MALQRKFKVIDQGTVAAIIVDDVKPSEVLTVKRVSRRVGESDEAFVTRISNILDMLITVETEVNNLNTLLSAIYPEGKF